MHWKNYQKIENSDKGGDKFFKIKKIRKMDWQIFQNI